LGFKFFIVSNRLQRVNKLIKREISQILLKEVDFPKDTLVTVTRVETSVDLNQANVFLSVMPEGRTSNVLRILNQLIYNLQQMLNKRLKMKPTPRLKFMKEQKTEEAGRIEEILAEIERVENENKNC